MMFTACDDGCTGVLLDDLDAIDVSMQSLNLSGVILAPYSLLIRLENQTQEFQVNASSSLLCWLIIVSHHLLMMFHPTHTSYLLTSSLLFIFHNYSFTSHTNPHTSHFNKFSIFSLIKVGHI